MTKLSIEQFTSKELISAIIKYLRADPNLPTKCYADDLEDGSWLKWYEDKLNEETE